MVQQGIYRDTLSKCTTYQNPYDIRYAGNSKLKEHRADVHRTDKIETHQSRIERETLHRFLSGNFSLPGGDRMVIVARVGKYLLLMVILPPYIFFYGLPKWLANHGLPWVIDGGKSLTNSMRKGWQKLERVVQAVRDFEKRLGESIDRGVTRIAQAFKSAMVDPMRRLYEEMQLRMQRFGDQLQKALEVYRQGMDRVNQSLQKFAESAKSILQNIQNAGNRFDKSASDAIMRSLQPAIALANRLGSVGSHLQSFAKNMQNRFESLSDRFKRASDAVSRSAFNVAKPIGDWTRSKAEKFVERYHAFEERLNKVVDRVGDRVNAFTNKVSTTVNNAIIVPTQNVINLAIQTAIKIPEPFIKVMEPALLRGRKYRDAFQRGMQKFGGFVSRSIKKIQKRIEIFTFAFKRTYHSILDLIRWLVDKMLLLPAKIFRFLKATFVVMAKIGYAIKYVVILTIAWVKVLIWYGFKTLKEKG